MARLAQTMFLMALLMPHLALAQTTVEFTFPGRVEPRQRVQVANQISGILQKIYVEPGQPVRRGDLMYALDDASYRIDVTAAEAARVEAKAPSGTLIPGLDVSVISTIAR
jgi:membrane fusion protein, multidrug efflux system